MSAPQPEATPDVIGAQIDSGGTGYIARPGGLPSGAHSLVMGPGLFAKLRQSVAVAAVSVDGSAATIEAIADSSVREGLILVRNRDGNVFAELDTGGVHTIPGIHYRHQR